MLNFVKAGKGTSEMIELVNRASSIIDLYPDIFPHLYQQSFKLEKYIEKGGMILQDGVVITFGRYKSHGKISKNAVKKVLNIPHKPANVYKKKGDFILHQIASNKSIDKAAEKVLHEFAEYCKSQHAENLFLTVRAENIKARAFYERNGFVKDGEIYWNSKIDGKIPGVVYKWKLGADKNIETVCI